LFVTRDLLAPGHSQSDQQDDKVPEVKEWGSGESLFMVWHESRSLCPTHTRRASSGYILILLDFIAKISKNRAKIRAVEEQ
jgi:hypothetical protein